MFAKLAALRAGRRHGAALARTHSNVPRRDLARAVGSPRAGRYVLVCRWLAAPATGKLECRWQIEPVVETPAEAPAPRWVKGDGPRGSTVRLRGKRARPQRVA
jgi:hypothetical protein